MPDLLKDKLDYVERAAKAYSEFKARTESNPMLTREEKIERIESFLDSHVSVFDEYFTEWGAYQQQRINAGKRVKSGDGLSSDAKDLAEDIAAVFTSSATRDFYNRNTEGRGVAAQGGYLDLRGRELLSNQAQAKNDDSDVSYSDTAEQNFRKQQQTTAMQPSAERRADQARTRAQDAQTRLQQAQTQAREAQAGATKARVQAETARRMAEQEDELAGDSAGDDFSRSVSDSAWEDVTRKEEAYDRAREALAGAQLEEIEARRAEAAASANLAGVQAAQARSRTSKVTKSRADQRNEWSRTAQSQFDAAQSQLKAAEDELQAAQDRAGDAQRAVAEASERARKAAEAAEKAGGDAEALEEQIEKNNPEGIDRFNQGAIDSAWDVAAKARSKAAVARTGAELAGRMEDDAKARRARAMQQKQTAKALRDQLGPVRDRETNQVVLFERQRTERTMGLSGAQIKGIREIGAFLFRNTLHGNNEDDRKFIGSFVDGINARTPRVKLLAFYLIENDELHSRPDNAKLALIQATYTPTLDGFKKHIFNGKFGGFFHRWSGDGLDWDKLSDAVHNAEDILTEAVSRQPLPPNAAGLLGQPAAAAGAAGGAGDAGGAGGQPADPQLMALLRNMAAAGVELLNNPSPSQEGVEALMRTVEELETYLTSQETSGWAEAKDFFKEAALWTGVQKKPLSVLASFIKGASERVRELKIEELQKTNPKYEGGGITGDSARLDVAGAVFSWSAVPFSLFNTVFSFISFATAIEQAIASGIGGWEKAKAVFGAVKEGSSSLLSVYGDVRSVAGVVDDVRKGIIHGTDKVGVAWLSNPYAVGAAAIGAIVVGTMTAAQGINTVRESDNERQAIEEWQSRMRRNPPDMANLSDAQRGELEAQSQMLMNVAGALRQNAIRKEVGGAFQTVSGALQIVSGGLMFASGGTAALASAAISLVAFCVGIGGTITDYFMKRKGKREVIDRYIGMDKLYADFKASKKEDLDPKGFVKKYGKEDEVKYMLRKTAEARLGFPGDDKMHSYIMWRYAQALYKGAFLDESGNVLTADRESDPQSGERQKRWIFVDLLKAAGFEVKYPDPPAGPAVNNPPVTSPSPDANAIFKKLMS